MLNLATLKPSQNKKGPNNFLAAPKRCFFSASSCKKHIIFGVARKMFGSFYFVTALADYKQKRLNEWFPKILEQFFKNYITVVVQTKRQNVLKWVAQANNHTQKNSNQKTLVSIH